MSAWRMSIKAAVDSKGTNASGGWKVAVAGTKQASGTIEGPWDDTDPIDDHMNAGDSVTLNLYSTAASFWTVPAIIESIDYEVSIDDGEIVSWTASFQSNGEVTDPT